MRTLCRVALAVVFTGTLVTSTHAAIISPYEIAFNVNGTVQSTLADGPLPGSLPGAWDLSAFDFTSGLGTISVTVTGGGVYSLLGFFDYEIDEAENTFFNEFAEAMGVAPAGLSWEIDEPGYSFGDIFTNFAAGALDNTNAVPAASPEDVAVALGWLFALAPGESALIQFTISELAPGGGFYLVHTDPDSLGGPASVYYSTSLTVRSEGVAEPSSILLLGLGLLLAGRRFRRV
jgi:hypothetical protein